MDENSKINQFSSSSANPSQCNHYSGSAGQLLLSSPLYLGSVPPHSSPHPPQMWSATAGVGLVGCIRDLVMNGRSVQLAELARTQDLG